MLYNYLSACEILLQFIFLVLVKHFPYCFKLDFLETTLYSRIMCRSYFSLILQTFDLTDFVSHVSNSGQKRLKITKLWCLGPILLMIKYIIEEVILTLVFTFSELFHILCRLFAAHKLISNYCLNATFVVFE